MEINLDWKQTGMDPGDLIAYHGEYCLRVERLGDEYYWWGLYYQSYPVDDCWTEGNPGTTLGDAKNRCKAAMVEHHKQTLYERTKH